MRALIALSSALLLGVFLAVVGAQKTPPSPLKVYVFTAAPAGGFVDRGLRARGDSLEDVREAISKRKDKWLEVVGSASESDMTLEITDRTVTETNRMAGNLRETEFRVKAKLQVGDYSTAMDGVMFHTVQFGVWSRAAGDLARELEKWARDNYARAVATRTTIIASAAPASGVAMQGPSEVAMAWLQAPTIQAGLEFVLPSTVEQLNAVRANFASSADAQTTLRLIELSIVPGPMLRAQGFSVSFTLGNATVTGDRASIPVSGLVPEQPPIQGKVELTRTLGGWRIVMVDLGPQINYSSTDKPNPVSAIAARLTTALEDERERGRYVTAIGAARRLASAQEMFAEVNGGYGAEIACLTAPGTCIAGWPADAQGFLKAQDLDGYSASFVAGAAPTAAELQKAGAARRSLKSWVYVLRPVAEGKESVCVDATNRVCTFTGPFAPAKAVACPATCKPLQ